MKYQRGLTLIELMIALVLSSIVVYAGISMFLASRGTASTTAAVGAITDSGRVALDFIADSVRGGGAMQCNAINSSNSSQTLNSILIPSGDSLLQDYSHAYAGFEAAGTGAGGTTTVASTPISADPSGSDWSTSGGGALDATLLNRVVQGSDIIAVREALPASTPAYLPSNPYTTYTPGDTVLTVANVETLQPLQYAVISDCSYATVFQIGAVDPATNQITTNGPLDGSGGNLGQSYNPGAAINALDMTVYFIAPGRDNDSALYSYDEWTGQFNQLVPDVENMQVLYGIGAPQSGQVTSYVTADLVPDFNQVISVQVALLVASPPGMRAVAQPTLAPSYSLLGTTVTAPIDERMRRVFVTTMAVENAAD